VRSSQTNWVSCEAGEGRALAKDLAANCWDIMKKEGERILLTEMSL